MSVTRIQEERVLPRASTTSCSGSLGGGWSSRFEPGLARVPHNSVETLTLCFMLPLHMLLDVPLRCSIGGLLLLLAVIADALVLPQTSGRLLPRQASSSSSSLGI